MLKQVNSDKTFAGRRDTAIIRLFIASGARLLETGDLRWHPDDPTTNDIDLDRSLIRVVGKGNRERPTYVGAKATTALDRYIDAPGRSTGWRTRLGCGSRRGVA